MGSFPAFAMDNSAFFKKFLEFDNRKDYYNICSLWAGLSMFWSFPTDG